MSLKKVSWAISIVLLASSFGSSNEQDQYLICSNGYCLTKGYNSADPPKPSEVGPLRIGVEIKLNQIIDALANTTSVRTDDIGEIALGPLCRFPPRVEFIKEMLDFHMGVHLIPPKTTTLALTSPHATRGKGSQI